MGFGSSGCRREKDQQAVRQGHSPLYALQMSDELPCALETEIGFNFARNAKMAQGSTQDRSQEHGLRSGSDFKEKATDTFEKLAGSATDQVGRVAGTVEGVATKVAQEGREAGQQVQEVAGNIKGAVDKSVKDQPMATLAIAAIAGFVLGALWNPKSSLTVRKGTSRGSDFDRRCQIGGRLGGRQVCRAGIVAVPFLVAAGFGIAALTLVLVGRFGSLTAYGIMAGGFAALGLVAALAVTVKEREEEVADAAAEHHDTAEVATDAAAQAAVQLPLALLGTLLTSPLGPGTALGGAKMIGRNLPLVALVSWWPCCLGPSRNSFPRQQRHRKTPLDHPRPMQRIGRCATVWTATRPNQVATVNHQTVREGWRPHIK